MKTVFFTFLLIQSAICAVAQTEQYLVSPQTLNMRSGSAPGFDVILKLSQGDEVTVLEKEKNGWWLVDFDGTQGFVSSQFLKKDPFSGWDKKNYASGTTPECENVIPEYDNKLDNYLKISVGANTDVVIKLMKRLQGGDICTRIVFIRSNETLDVKNIPEGNYYLKIAYGRDWRQKIIEGQCYGRFVKNALYQIGEEKLNYNIVRLNDRSQIPSYELFLDVTESVHGSKFNSNTISEAEFNN